MGRIAKRIIETFNYRVIGTDISTRMLEFADYYVGRADLFETIHCLGACDIYVVIASLVLQHVEHPRQEIEKLHSLLKPGGFFVLLNEARRFVPVGIDNEGFVIWHDDGIVVQEIMSEFFENIGYYKHRNRTDKPLSVWRK